MNKIKIVSAAVAMFASAVFINGSNAVPVSFTGSSGNLKATVQFDVSGSTLIVKLTNSSTYDVLVPADVLTGVFFNIPGNPTLTKTSAKLGAGSFVVNPPAIPTDPAPDGVGGEWGYLSGLSADAPYGANQGIASAGYGVGAVDFGPGTRFPGADLDSPAAPNGMNYGILSTGDNTATGNAPILTNPFIKDTVIFELGGLPPGFALSSIGSVSFQYGTSLEEPNIPGNPGGDDPGGGGGNPGAIPEPSTLALFGLGLVAMGFTLRNRLGKSKEETAE